jgi:hypothetical protein
MSKIEGTDFNKESAFKQASAIADQLKLIENNEDLNQIIKRADRIASAMTLDLDSVYNSLSDALNMINEPEPRRIIEDVRDEVYRCMR